MSRGLTPDYTEINNWLYTSLSEVLQDMRHQRANSTEEASIALEALDAVEQTLNAIKRDLGAI